MIFLSDNRPNYGILNNNSLSVIRLSEKISEINKNTNPMTRAYK